MANVGGWRLEGIRFLSAQNLLINLLLVMVIVAYIIIPSGKVINGRLYGLHLALSSVALLFLKVPFLIIAVPRATPMPAEKLISLSSTLLSVSYIGFLIVQIGFAIYLSTLFTVKK